MQCLSVVKPSTGIWLIGCFTTWLMLLLLHADDRSNKFQKIIERLHFYSWFISFMSWLCYDPAPSKPPSGFTVTARNSTSVTASWQLPPADSRNGIIKGFKLFINSKGSDDERNVQFIDVSNDVYKRIVTGLQESTEYELQVLAYTSAGDGTNSSVQFVKTLRDGKSYNFFFWKIDTGWWLTVKFIFHFCDLVD